MYLGIDNEIQKNKRRLNKISDINKLLMDSIEHRLKYAFIRKKRKIRNTI